MGDFESGGVKGSGAASRKLDEIIVTSNSSLNDVQAGSVAKASCMPGRTKDVSSLRSPPSDQVQIDLNQLESRAQWCTYSAGAVLALAGAAGAWGSAAACDSDNKHFTPINVGVATTITTLIGLGVGARAHKLERRAQTIKEGLADNQVSERAKVFKDTMEVEGKSTRHHIGQEISGLEKIFKREIAVPPEPKKSIPGLLSENFKFLSQKDFNEVLERGGLIKSIHSQLRSQEDHGQNVVSLTGVEGVGKTVVAQAYAA